MEYMFSPTLRIPPSRAVLVPVLLPWPTAGEHGALLPAADVLQFVCGFARKMRRRAAGADATAAP